MVTLKKRKTILVNPLQQRGVKSNRTYRYHQSSCMKKKINNTNQDLRSIHINVFFIRGHITLVVFYQKYTNDTVIEVLSRYIHYY